MAEASAAVSSRPELSRDLGVSHASAVVVGTIIGSGIFLVPAEMMQAVGSAKLVYLAWIVGGVLSFAGALTYAELGAMKPQTGGEYVYVRDAYGPLGGFLYAWTWFVIAKPASIATIVTGLVRILGTFPIFSFFSLNAINAPLAVTWRTDIRHRRRRSRFVHELPRGQEGGRIPTCLYASESRHHSGNRGGVLQRNRQFRGPGMEQLRTAPSPGRKAESPASWRHWWPPCGPMTGGMI